MMHFDVTKVTETMFDTASVAWVVHGFVRCDICGRVATERWHPSSGENIDDYRHFWRAPGWSKRAASVLPCVDKLATFGSIWKKSLFTIANDVCCDCTMELRTLRRAYRQLQETGEYRAGMRRVVTQWDRDPEYDREVDLADRMASVFFAGPPDFVAE